MNELALTTEELPTFKGTEYEDHVNTWLDVDRSVQGHYWMLGAIAASLVKEYGEDAIGKFAGDVGASKQRIWRYARTYRDWENFQRSNILSFHHHSVAGRSDDPQRAIEVAEDEQLSTRELETFVKTGELPNHDETEKLEEVEDVGGMEIARIVRTAKMEYVVEYGDGAHHTVNRDALFDAGFKKCRNCSGRGIEERHHRI